MHHEGVGEVGMPLELGIEVLNALHECVEAHIGGNGLLQLGELAVAIDEGGESCTGVVDGADACLVGCSLDFGTVHVGLRDGADRCSSIHDFVCQHSGEALPRLHLVLCHEAVDVCAEVVECFL